VCLTTCARPEKSSPNSPRRAHPSRVSPHEPRENREEYYSPPFPSLARFNSSSRQPRARRSSLERFSDKSPCLTLDLDVRVARIRPSLSRVLPSVRCVYAVGDVHTLSYDSGSVFVPRRVVSRVRVRQSVACDYVKSVKSADADVTANRPEDDPRCRR
jgi:hypothetical protein